MRKNISVENLFGGDKINKSELENIIINCKIVTCRPYRPETKGKVEKLAKIMNRLKAFDYEFDDKDDLIKIVKNLNYILNYEEKSQALNDIPINYFVKEKEYLKPINYEILENYYLPQKKTYRVSNESMISYQGIKYSVPIQYVGKELTVLEEDNVIHIYYSTDLIVSYKKNAKYRYNYKVKDYIDILKHSSFNNSTDEEIQKYINQNLKSLDGINIEKKEKIDLMIEYSTILYSM